MGLQSQKSMPFMCGACKKGFGSKNAAVMHAKDAHRHASGIGIYQRVTHVTGADYDDSPSMAELAVEAELDRAMGIPNDNDWLLP